MKNNDLDLLLVDDDDDFRSVAAQRFRKSNLAVQEAPDGESALALCERRSFDVAVVDMRMPGMSGLDLLEKIKQVTPDCETIILTAEGTIETAVSAIKQGAFDYLTKPFSLAELETVIRKADERRRLKKENTQLREVISRSSQTSEIVGESPAMQNIYRLIERAGPSEKPILIQGESGTGKELVAQALHQNSSRRDKPMVVINCAALPESLLESELFGHEKGAFTGAVASKPGLFEVADGGTLFVDEIGELPTALQAKLLRVLEDGSLRRVGSLQERRVSVRLLAATNRDLREEINAGRFREDLYYRIDVMTIKLPKLSEREGDVSLLIDTFLGADWQIEPQARQALESYGWPGNVRQLINVIERAKILGDHKTIGLWDLPEEIADPQKSDTAVAARPVNDDLATMTRAHVVETLRKEKGNKARSARRLGVSRRSLYRLLEKYDIQPAELESDVRT
ncbi:MAG: sigma-54 dependent transcriptional regulator [Pirellulales bacterium]|nr:sigma-54 dependent transcriptional regulator [Pirellulales bacterium]